MKGVMATVNPARFDWKDLARILALNLIFALKIRQRRMAALTGVTEESRSCRG